MDQNEHRRTQAEVANDGSNTSRPENTQGAGAQQQGDATRTPAGPNDTTGRHGGNHGNDGGELVRDARGSSHRGDEPNAESRNTGGGDDNQRKPNHHSQNTTKDRTAYNNGGQTPSTANDGGKIDDANNQ
ncbi:hypothetical protein [Hymenobacter chitinivorans]|uniref:Uncharacterized protein n=1 Tax=Hymenobacter chitinivorans DSM 11115 TaxID=1121954 RepID=A0A2M9AS70_9BACT|nr:hypothetical protein [Hymenobacter chitinivorans]PJJ48540.1 hypothetical protein CLV45_4249 [Hymenobacter chitinivorans DSM 11115]